MSFLVCGLDEVGRGALAGPLVAVASLFHSEAPAVPPNTLVKLALWELGNSPVPGVDDSKKLSAKKRRYLFHQILHSDKLIDFGLGEVSADEINIHGIDWANSQAFSRAVKDLKYQPHYILIDGENPLYGWNMLYQRVEPKADGMWWPVAAASILAKVIRDDFMSEMGQDYPAYDFNSNSGYGSPRHKGAIQRFGSLEGFHRTKFIRRIKFFGPEPLQLPKESHA
jgi:ribonuclease HII